MTTDGYYTEFKRKMCTSPREAIRTKYGRFCDRCGGRLNIMVELQEPDDLVRVRVCCSSCAQRFLDKVVNDPDDLEEDDS
jgi:hypothetical protein